MNFEGKKYNLKVLRVLNNLTLKEAAVKLGVSPTTLSNWERGLTYPGVINIKKIEEIYNVRYQDIDFLIVNKTVQP